jgi:hypothetical protein
MLSFLLEYKDNLCDALIVTHSSDLIAVEILLFIAYNL